MATSSGPHPNTPTSSTAAAIPSTQPTSQKTSANGPPSCAPPTDLLDKYHINFCIIPHASPMTVVLPLLPNWKSVYSDDTETVFVRTPALPASN